MWKYIQGIWQIGIRNGLYRGIKVEWFDDHLTVDMKVMDSCYAKAPLSFGKVLMYNCHMK